MNCRRVPVLHVFVDTVSFISRAMKTTCDTGGGDCSPAARPRSSSDTVRALKVPGAMQAILALMERLKKDKKLPDGKRLYVKLGCRGDWPDIQEPSWVPPELTPAA